MGGYAPAAFCSLQPRLVLDSPTIEVAWIPIVLYSRVSGFRVS